MVTELKAAMLVSSRSHANRALSEQGCELRPPARNDLHDATAHERKPGEGTAHACERAENLPKPKVACRSKTHKAAAGIGAVALTEAQTCDAGVHTCFNEQPQA